MPAVKEVDPRAEQVADLVRDTELSTLSLWSDLDQLSTHTQIDGVEVDPDGIIVRADGTFSGAFNIYVSLQYGNDNEEGFTTSDSFLATFDGHFDGDDPVIEHSEVDTSAFYE